MNKVQEEVKKHQALRSTTDVIIRDGRFVKKLERDYGLENFEQNYKAHEKKQLAGYKHFISSGFQKVMNEEKMSEEYAVRKVAEELELDVRTNTSFQKTNHQFHDHLTWVWKGALEILEEGTALEKKPVLEEVSESLN